MGTTKSLTDRPSRINGDSEQSRPGPAHIRLPGTLIYVACVPGRCRRGRAGIPTGLEAPLF